MIRFFEKRRGTKEYEENKKYLLPDLIKTIKLLLKSKSTNFYMFYNEATILCLRNFLLENSNSLRMQILMFVRYLIQGISLNPGSGDKLFPFLIEKHFHYYIC